MVEFNINKRLRHIFRLHLTVEFEDVCGRNCVCKTMDLCGASLFLYFHCMFGSIEEMLVSVFFVTTWIFAKCLSLQISDTPAKVAELSENKHKDTMMVIRRGLKEAENNNSRLLET